MSDNTPYPFTPFDAQMMARAFRLAEKGRYSTTPNPHVGCVIVNAQGQIIGEGFHQKAGLGHAEVNALAKAGSAAKGACAYVTLEPCAHTNRTGPCAQALINAGVKRVVVSCTDPNPKVAGKGIAMLEAQGIEVNIGLMQQEGEALNHAFFFRMQHNRPYVRVKLAASLDGKIALADGSSKWITSAQARHDVQVQRAQACAILTGADTVIADNPMLNVRVNELPSQVSQAFLWREKQPLRVVIDSQNRLDASQYQMLNGKAPTLVYNLRANVKLSQDKESCLSQQQLDAVMNDSRRFIDLHSLMADLAQKQINVLWVEAGASLSGALFDAGLVDELLLYQAPKLLGKTSRSLSDITAPPNMQDVLSGDICDVRKIGVDTRTSIRFKQQNTE